MEYIIFYVILAIFTLVYISMTDLDTENEIKISFYILVAFVVGFYFIMDEVKNPKSYNHYIGTVVDKKIVVSKRKESYYTTEYFIYSNIRNSQECKQEVNETTYHKTYIGEVVLCNQSVINYMLLDQEKFKTVESIRNRFKKELPERREFALKQTGHHLYIDPRLKNNEIDFGSKFKKYLTVVLDDFLNNKPYVLQVLFVKEFDIDVISALKEKWNGVNY